MTRLTILPGGGGAQSLPQDHYLERNLLGGAMLDPTVLDQAAHVSPEAFYSQSHQILWAYLLDMRARGLQTDMVSVVADMGPKLAEAAGGLAYISGLGDDTPPTVAAPQWVARILDLSERRGIVMQALRTRDVAMDLDIPLADVRIEVEKLISKAVQVDTEGDGWVCMDEGAEMLYQDLLDRREARRAGITIGISTGLPAVDQRLGGIHPGDLSVLAARPGMGKTALALQMAEHVARESGPVAFVSLEMPLIQLLRRDVARTSGVHATKISEASWTDAEWPQIEGACDRLAGLRYLVSDESSIPASRLPQHIRRADYIARKRWGQGLALVVVDYLQLIGGGGNKSREQEVAGISRSLKVHVARGMKTHVLALSQLNRECEGRADKRPRASDLRESGSLEQDASNILLLLRMGAYPEVFRGDEALTEIIVAKARHGKPGSAWALWDGGHQVMTQHEDQETRGRWERGM